MSDLTVVIEENPLQLVIEPQAVSVYVEEDNYTVSAPQEITQVNVSSEDVKIITVAEQGPPGVGGSGSGGLPIYVGSTAPDNAPLGAIWIETN